MEKDILYREGDFHIQRHQGIPKAAFTFLESIAWGSEGAVYENKKIEQRIRTLHNPTLIAIYEGEKIQGTAAFCQTPVTVDGKEFNCFYIRYFASSKEIRGRGIVKHFSSKVMEVIRDNDTEKTIYFACFEKGNMRSYKVVESAGYEYIGTVKTIGFSRFFPKRSSKQIEQVRSETGRKEVISLLKKEYQSHGLAQFNSIFQNDNYYVIRKDGEIVAGCQYHRVHWVINKMPGFSGKIIMNIVPRIPVLNKLFNPKRFEFLAFEGIFAKNGHEQLLGELFEDLLAKEHLKSSMIWMGETCPVLRSILENLNVGLIHSFVKDSDIRILAAYKNMSDEEINALKSQPIYASAFDFT